MEKPTFDEMWSETKLKIKKANPKITDTDLHYEDKHEDEFLTRLETKTKMNRDELIAWINSL
ncbi:MAG: general stress protein CsbD [Bacteroidota bacterium]